MDNSHPSTRLKINSSISHELGNRNRDASAFPLHRLQQEIEQDYNINVRENSAYKYHNNTSRATIFVTEDPLASQSLTLLQYTRIAGLSTLTWK